MCTYAQDMNKAALDNDFYSVDSLYADPYFEADTDSLYWVGEGSGSIAYYSQFLQWKRV